MHTYGVHLTGNHDVLTALASYKEYQFIICDVFPSKSNLIPYPGIFHIQTLRCLLNAGARQSFSMCPLSPIMPPASALILNGASTQALRRLSFRFPKIATQHLFPSYQPTLKMPTSQCMLLQMICIFLISESVKYIAKYIPSVELCVALTHKVSQSNLLYYITQGIALILIQSSFFEANEYGTPCLRKFAYNQRKAKHYIDSTQVLQPSQLLY